MRHQDPRDFAVAAFQALEGQMSECLEYIPYLKQNLAVVSPRLMPILMEACSLIESVFRYTVGDSKRHTLKSYAAILEPSLELESASTLLLVSPLGFLRPFFGWSRAAPSWWEAYNHVKHDRLANHDAASLESTITALAGLHQVLARDRLFGSRLDKAGWINRLAANYADLYPAMIEGACLPELVVESNLFVSATCDSFVDWSDHRPALLAWDFSMRVNAFIAEDEGHFS